MPHESDVVLLFECPVHGLMSGHGGKVKTSRRVVFRCPLCSAYLRPPIEYVSLGAVQYAVLEAASTVTDRPRLTWDRVLKTLRRGSRG